MLNIDNVMLQQIANEHAKATHKERRPLLQRYASMLGTTQSTLYRKIKNLKITPTADMSRRTDYGTNRLTDQEQFDKDMYKIAGIKALGSNGKDAFIGTALAIDIAFRNKEISQLYSETTVNRWLNKYQINRKAYQRPTPAAELFTEYSMQTVVIDATVSNLYYLNSDGKFVEDSFLFLNRSHQEDEIKKRKYRKIWVYYIVDLYSKVYWVKAYADYRLGENSTDYADFLTEVYTQDKKFPFCGLPTLLYSDPGSAVTSGIMQNMAQYFGYQTLAHEAKLARAKGAVERRIGAFKQSKEKLILTLGKKRRPTSIEEYNRYIQDWAMHENHTNGFLAKWYEGLKLRPTPLVVPTQYDVSQSLQESFTRTVNRRCRVSIDGKEWELEGLPDVVAEKVTIFKRFGGTGKPETMFAADKNNTWYKLIDPTYKILADGEHWKKLPASEARINQALATQAGRDFSKLISIDSISAPKIDMSHFPPPNQPFKTTSIAPLESYDTAETAWLFITAETGIARGKIETDLQNKIDTVLSLWIEQTGSVPSKEVLTIVNLITRKEEEEKSTGS